MTERHHRNLDHAGPSRWVSKELGLGRGNSWVGLFPRVIRSLFLPFPVHFFQTATSCVRTVDWLKQLRRSRQSTRSQAGSFGGLAQTGTVPRFDFISLALLSTHPIPLSPISLSLSGEARGLDPFTPSNSTFLFFRSRQPKGVRWRNPSRRPRRRAANSTVSS